MNAADHQDTILGFDLAANVRAKPAIACIDLARLQRAPEGTEHSPTRRGDDVVDRCRMRFSEFGFIHAVVFGDAAVNTEDDRRGLARQLSHPKRTFPPIYMDV